VKTKILARAFGLSTQARLAFAGQVASAMPDYSTDHLTQIKNNTF